MENSQKYKIGDKIRIKSKDWYDKNKNGVGYVSLLPYKFSEEMSKYCGKITTISQVFPDCYWLKGLPKTWTDEMFVADFFEQLPIGETFQFEGHKLRVVNEEHTCEKCFFNKDKAKDNHFCGKIFLKGQRPMCVKELRIDNNSVIFKEIIDVEKGMIKVDITTAKKWYNSNNKELRDLALTIYSEEELKAKGLPKSWEEFCNNNKIKIGEVSINSDSEICKYASEKALLSVGT